MYIEIDGLNKKREFLLALLDYHLFTGNKIYIQINKGIHLIDKCRMFLKYKGRFVYPGLLPVPIYYFKADSNFIGFLKNVYVKDNLKWNIIDHAKNTCLAFNYHDANSPLLEIQTQKELLDLNVFLNTIKEKGVITNYNIVNDD